MSRLPVKAFQGIALMALSVTQPALSHIRTKPEGFYITLPVNYGTCHNFKGIPAIDKTRRSLFQGSARRHITCPLCGE